MDDYVSEIKVSKNTQEFVTNLSNLSQDKYTKVMNTLCALKNQNEAEAYLEDKKGWRYMWQRTPKPYLLMLAYLVFLAPVGSFGYQAFSNVSDNFKIIFLISLSLIMILPLLVVFYLSYNFVKHGEKEEKIE